MITADTEFKAIKNAVSHALTDFSKNDLQLLELSTDEWVATHRIACYLQIYFPHWDVDCEYNRKGREIKRLHGHRKRPDIIIHHRGIPENLVVIEVKKSDNTDNEIEKDRNKLIQFTKQPGDFNYKFGLLVIPSTDEPYSVQEEWYENGLRICEFSRIFEEIP